MSYQNTMDALKSKIKFCFSSKFSSAHELARALKYDFAMKQLLKFFLPFSFACSACANCKSVFIQVSTHR